MPRKACEVGKVILTAMDAPVGVHLIFFGGGASHLIQKLTLRTVVRLTRWAVPWPGYVTNIIVRRY